LICVALSFVCPIIFIVYKAYGVNNYGYSFYSILFSRMCSVLVTIRSVAWGTIFEFLYILSAFYTVWFFNKNIPKDETTLPYRNKMIKRYVVYISASVIMFISLGISSIMSRISSTR